MIDRTRGFPETPAEPKVISIHRGLTCKRVAFAPVGPDYDPTWFKIQALSVLGETEGSTFGCRVLYTDDDQTLSVTVYTD